MARGINKVILIGNLGGNVEMKALPSGQPLANFSVATTNQWKDKQTGQMRENTEWHNIVAFNRLAEICGQFLRKGSKVYIEGELKTRNWDDQQTGKKMYRTEIICRDMQMLDGAGQQERLNDTNGQQQQYAPQNPDPGLDQDIPF